PHPRPPRAGSRSGLRPTRARPRALRQVSLSQARRRGRDAQARGPDLETNTSEMVSTMDPKDFRKKLGGVIAFPVTPFQRDLSLDIPGLRRNQQGLIQQKLCAGVDAGGTGELYSLAPSEHFDVV